MKTTDEIENKIRAEFEKSCVILTKGNTNPYAKAKKDREYLKEGDYILSDMMVAWKVAEPLLNVIAVKEAEIARLRESMRKVLNHAKVHDHETYEEIAKQALEAGV